MSLVLEGRVIKEGTAEGAALVSSEPIGFLGGVDPDTGVVREKGHPLEGACLTGRVLVFPRGKGSTVGSYVIYSLAHNEVGPAGMVLSECEPIVALGAIMAGIPVVDMVDITRISEGELVRIEGGTVTVG